jgi:hypothetical protein
LQAFEPYQAAQSDAWSSGKTLVASFSFFFFQKEKEQRFFFSQRRK